jgi:predicted RNA-binding Zn-ribbon protein involved in translation (DUF1610 family)
MRATHAPCRKCGVSLMRTDHMKILRYEATTSRFYDERLRREHIQTHRHPVYQHTPCPNCGDPQPMNSWRHKLPAILVWSAFVAAAAGGLYLFSL